MTTPQETIERLEKQCDTYDIATMITVIKELKARLEVAREALSAMRKQVDRGYLAGEIVADRAFEVIEEMAVEALAATDLTQPFPKAE